MYHLVHDSNKEKAILTFVGEKKNLESISFSSAMELFQVAGPFLKASKLNSKKFFVVKMV